MKISAFILIFSGLVGLSRSQTTEYYYSFHFNDLNYGEDIIFTVDSHFVALGNTYSYGIPNSSKSCLIKLDKDGDSVYTRFLPPGMLSLVELHDHNYCLGARSFNYKTSPEGDSIWKKPARIIGHSQWTEGMTALNDGYFYTICTEYPLEDNIDPYGMIKKYDPEGEFVTYNSFTMSYSYGVEIASSPSGLVCGLASPLWYDFPFFRIFDGPFLEIDTIPNPPLDLCFANDSIIFILGVKNNVVNLLKLDRTGAVIDVAEDICPPPAYHICALNDTTLLIVGSNQSGLRLSQVGIDLEPLCSDVMSEYGMHAINELIYIQDQFVAMTGYTGTVNDSTNMFILGLNIPAHYTGVFPVADESIQTLQIFPNPSNDKFYIDARNLKQISNIDIFNISGQEISFEVEFITGYLVLKLDAEKSGIYILKLVEEQRTFICKLILN